MTAVIGWIDGAGRSHGTTTPPRYNKERRRKPKNAGAKLPRTARKEGTRRGYGCCRYTWRRGKGFSFRGPHEIHTDMKTTRRLLNALISFPETQFLLPQEGEQELVRLCTDGNLLIFQRTGLEASPPI